MKIEVHMKSADIDLVTFRISALLILYLYALTIEAVFTHSTSLRYCMSLGKAIGTITKLNNTE